MSKKRSPVQEALLRRRRASGSGLDSIPLAGAPGLSSHTARYTPAPAYPSQRPTSASPTYPTYPTSPCVPHPRSANVSLSPAARNFIRRSTTSYNTKLRRRKALLIGIGYRNHRYLTPVPGARNDIIAMYDLLTGPCFGFLESSVHILCDEPLISRGLRARLPTKRDIIQEMGWLTEGITAGDSIVFFFAGHGEMVQDTSGDEIETGFDQFVLFAQCIMPVDFMPRRMFDDKGRLPFRGVDPILDDIIYNQLVRAVPEGAKITAIVDACKSGTICDLPVLYDDSGVPRYRNGASQPPRDLRHDYKSAGGCVLFSGSADHQLSADMLVTVRGTNGEGPTHQSFGIMTRSFVDAVHEMCRCRGPNYNGVESWSYGDLLRRVKELVKQRCGVFVPSYLERQEPQLSSSHAFNLWQTNFSM